MADDYSVDLGNVSITSNAALSARPSEAAMLGSATKAITILFSQLKKLPMTKKRGNTGVSELVQLPLPEMRLPRQRPPPKPRELTPWQKFAQKKGIALKREKTNRRWNEERQEWEDKWGKRRREADRGRDWMREVKEDYVPAKLDDDPFIEERRSKVARLEKQEKKEVRNQKRRQAVTQEMAQLDFTAQHLVTASHGRFDKIPRKRK